MVAIYRRAKGRRRVGLGTRMSLFIIEGIFIWLIAEFAESAMVAFVSALPLWALVVAMQLTFYFIVLFEDAIRHKVKWKAPIVVLILSFLMFGVAELLTPLPK